MAIEEQSCTGGEARVHAGCVPRIELDEDEALPGRAVTFGFGPELAEERFLEFEDFDDLVGGDQGTSGDRGIGEQDVFKFVGARRKDGGAFVDFSGIEQVEDGKVLDGENLVHAFQAEATLAVEEI